MNEDMKTISMTIYEMTMNSVPGAQLEVRYDDRTGMWIARIVDETNRDADLLAGDGKTAMVGTAETIASALSDLADTCTITN